MRCWVLVIAAFLPVPLAAESLVAARLIRATEVIGPGDVLRVAETVPGAARELDQIVGLEARVALYPGRPVRLADLGPAAVIERHDVVRLVYRRAGLTIQSDGRALARGGLGDPIRVMNLGSHQSVTGIVTHDGIVEVAGSAGPRP